MVMMMMVMMMMMMMMVMVLVVRMLIMLMVMTMMTDYGPFTAAYSDCLSLAGGQPELWPQPRLDETLAVGAGLSRIQVPHVGLVQTDLFRCVCVYIYIYVCIHLHIHMQMRI